MNFHDLFRARRIARGLKRRRRELAELRRALLRVHLIQTTDSAAWDYCAKGKSYGN